MLRGRVGSAARKCFDTVWRLSVKKAKESQKPLNDLLLPCSSNINVMASEGRVSTRLSAARVCELT